MNIVVLTANGKTVVRPDTTWERDNEDLYVPEFVDSMSWTPVLFARISKPGRSVGLKFADRYYDGIGFGMLLYPENLIDGSPEGYACACCLDHSSFLPFPVKDKSLLKDEIALTVSKDGSDIYSKTFLDPEIIEKSIAEVTKYCYIRTGDLVVIELEPRGSLCGREDCRCELSGSLCGEISLVFKIVY